MLNDWKNPEIPMQMRIIGMLGEVGAASKVMLSTLTNMPEIDDELDKLIESGIALKANVNNDNGEVFFLSPIGQEMYENTVHLKVLNVSDQGGVNHVLDVLSVTLRVQAKIPNVDLYTTQETRDILKLLNDFAKTPPSADISSPDALIFGAKWAIWLQVLPRFVGVSVIAKMATEYARVFNEISGFNNVIWVAQDAEQARRARMGIDHVCVLDTSRVSISHVYTLGNEANHIIALAKMT